MIKVAILGASGYTAVELIKLLLRHPGVSIVAATSRQDESVMISDLHHSLTGRLKLQCQPFNPDRLMAQGVQVAFGCLPHGASMEFLPHLLSRGVRVIDLSADYRLRDPNIYAQWYGESHDDLAHLAQAVYGLPEIYGDDIPTAQLIANPGCYPQTAILGLAPLVAARYINTNNIIIDSKSGVSGAGRTPKLNVHFPECNESVSAYSIGNHRHTPEIEQALGDVAGEAVDVIFSPHLIPMDRGIFSTIYAVPKRNYTQEQLLELYRDYYRKAPFVRIVDHLPSTKDTMMTNFVHITLRVVKGKILVLSCIDNLIRGASGVALQNFNLMYGFEETTALL